MAYLYAFTSTIEMNCQLDNFTEFKIRVFVIIYVIERG